MTLKETQRRMAAVLMTPLAGSERLARRTRSGASIAQEAVAIIRPNDRLTSLERLEIYSRSYWFRLLDSIRDDYPGLRAILGTRRFDRLATAYLADCPSTSFTLRDLGSGLEGWLSTHPGFGGSHLRLALDMARLEWAHIVAFDGAEEKPLSPEDLAEITPKLRVGVQPYITLLELSYPVDVLRVRLKNGHEEVTEASNFTLRQRRRSSLKPASLKRERVYLAVHRAENSVYYRRLEHEEYLLLAALRARGRIAGAIVAALRGSPIPREEIPDKLRAWFNAWAQLGWLTVRSQSKEHRK